MKHYDIKELEEKTNVSRSKIFRFYRSNENIKNETTLGKKRLYPETHVKYFNSKLLFEANVALEKKNKEMKNLIDDIHRNEIFFTQLWKLDWTHFFTVAYKYDLKQATCYDKMTAAYNHIAGKYGTETKLRLLFATEPFSDRDGFHNHGVLYVEKPELRDVIETELKKFFRYDRTDFEKYDKYKAGLFYSLKKGINNDAWDILGNIPNEKLDQGA